jgi:hypothetical protein
MSIPKDEKKSLEEILGEHLLNKTTASSNRLNFFDLLAQEVKSEMKDAALSFDSLMRMQKRLTEAYLELINKNCHEKK